MKSINVSQFRKYAFLLSRNNPNAIILTKLSIEYITVKI